MIRLRKPLEGSMTALATPFKDGALDEAAYRALVDYQVENGTAVLVPMGTTGEPATMSPAERVQAIKACLDQNKGRALVFAGAGTNSTRDSIEAVKTVRELGADGAMLVTPYYNKPTQQGVVEHFKAVAKAHPGYPLLAYNVPGRTGFDLLPDTVQKLAEVEEVVALKEATGSVLRLLDIVEKIGTERLALLSGDDFIVAPFVACGGKGVISVSANVAPRQMADLVAAARKGDNKRAVELQLLLQPLHRLLFVESNPIPVKMALHLMGRFGREIRLPLTEMTEPNAAKLKLELQKLGLVKG
jgi:4-hydroxy-tetrahydrodipicolinate synthase